jgi:hypothetical protein
VPPPGQQVAALHERLLEEAGLTRDKRIELTKRLIESLERGLEAETVKGPVRDGPGQYGPHAGGRAAGPGAQRGTAASRRDSSGPLSVVINIKEPEWMRNPTPQPTGPAAVVLDVPVDRDRSA